MSVTERTSLIGSDEFAAEGGTVASIDLTATWSLAGLFELPDDLDVLAGTLLDLLKSDELHVACNLNLVTMEFEVELGKDVIGSADIEFDLLRRALLAALADAIHSSTRLADSLRTSSHSDVCAFLARPAYRVEISDSRGLADLEAALSPR